MASLIDRHLKGSLNHKSTLKGTIQSKGVLQGVVNSTASLTGFVSISTIIKDDTSTYLLVDENGNEIPAVLVDEPVTLTATANDIRLGTTAVTGDGVIEGTKEIPSYHTTFGSKAIENGSRFVLSMKHYDYTKLQAIICSFNKSLNNSVAAEKVVIDNKIYSVRSIESESYVGIDDEKYCVDFGIVNNSGKPCVLRYSSYKEIY